MSTIKVSQIFRAPALAAGVSIASVAVTVTDFAGATQKATLVGTETPTPWSKEFTVAAGKGSVTSVATDSTNTAAAPIVQPYDTGTASSGPTTGLSGTTVQTVTP